MKGLKLPVGVDHTGGAAISEGEENNTELLFTVLSDCDSENAYQQDLGLGSEMIFRVDEETLGSEVVAKLKGIFKAFEAEHRFQLLKDTIVWTSKGDGEAELSFKYHDLESDEILPFSKIFGAQG